MPTSRLMIRIVNQSGMRLTSPMFGSVSTMNVVTKQQLVGRGIQPGAKLAFLPGRAGGETVQQIRQAGDHEREQRPAEFSVEGEDHERRDQQHAKQRQLIRDGEDLRAHGRARASRRPMISIASAPVTARSRSKLPLLSGITPEATAIDTAG